MRALLDVNVLIALNDQGHIHHTLANQWMAQHMHLGWASCSLTQNGMLRIMSQASYVNSQKLNILFQMLRRETQHAQGRFITLDKRIPLNAVPGAKPVHLVSL